MLSPNKKHLILQLLEFPDINENNCQLLKEKEMIINQIKMPIFT